MLGLALYAALMLFHATDLPPGAVLRLGDARFRAGGPVKHLRFSDDGRILKGWVVGPMAKLLPIAWDATTGFRLVPPADLVPPDLAFNATSAVQLGESRVLTAGPGGVARIWDAGTGREVVRLRGHTWPVTAVAASAGGERLATGDTGGLVRLWDGATFRPLVEPAGHRSSVAHAELSSDGKRLLTETNDDSVRVWDLTTGRELRAFADVPHDLADENDIFLQRATFTPDGLAVVFSTKDRLIARDILTGLEVPLPGDMAEHRPAIAIFAPDGKTVLTHSPSYELAVWDWPSGRRRFRVERTGGSLGFSPDGTIIFTTSGSQKRWIAKTGQELGRAWESSRTGSVEPAFALVPNPQLLVDTRDGAARIIQAGTGQLVPEYELASIRPEWRWLPPPYPSPADWPIAFSPTGRQFAREPNPAVPQFVVHEAATGEVRRRFEGYSGYMRILGFTPDGTRLLTAGSDHTILVWDVRVQALPLPDAIRRETKAAKLWDMMCTGTAAEAYQAMARFAAEPPAAVRMARLRLKPADSAEEESAATRLADTRAIELLEALGTVEARAFLKELAGGDDSARLTREARRALKRKTGDR